MPTDVTLPERYQARRQSLMQQMQSTAPGIAFIQSSHVAPDPSLWDKNLLYLTGLADRHAALLLAPNGVRVERAETRTGPELMRGREVHEILFLAERSPQELLHGWSILLSGGAAADHRRRPRVSAEPT